MRRRVWILAVALLVAIPIADMVLWRVAIGRLGAGFVAWAARCRAAGLSVTWGRTISGGWPLAATLTIDDVNVTDVNITSGDPRLPGGLAWHTGNLALRVTLIDPNILEIEPLGTQRVRLPGAGEIGVTAGRLLAAVNLVAPGEPQELDIQVDNVRASQLKSDDPARMLSIGQAHYHSRFVATAGQGEPGVKFSFESEAIGLPTAIRWPLGASLTSAAISGTILGPIPAAQTLTAWATAWRDGGGSLELQHLALAWGPLNLTASATLALDEQLQPMGAGNSHLTGYAATLDALAGTGVLSRSAAIASKAVLSLLAGTPAEGEIADVDVPLTLQFRTLSMRQVPLLRLPELDWPGQ